VPVVHDAQGLTLWDLAAEMRRVSEAARTNKAKREELTGSTSTITSLGKLGGIASTPINQRSGSGHHRREPCPGAPVSWTAPSPSGAP